MKVSTRSSKRSAKNRLKPSSPPRTKTRSSWLRKPRTCFITCSCYWSNATLTSMMCARSWPNVASPTAEARVPASKHELTELLEFATALARGAGDITLSYFQRQPETSRKADGSYVTVADREAEAYLRRQIAERFPDDGVLGEEEGEHKGRSGRRWIVDPIDGTYAFVHGVPLYGVLIALEIDSQPLIGVVNMPALGEVVAAAAGVGCFFNGAPARVSAKTALADSLL